MKKFQFAAGFAALAMLASCSSDAPEGPNVGPEEGDGSFIAMKITTASSTRDGEDADAVVSKDNDEDINDITLYIVDKDGDTYTTLRRLYTENIENGYAYFNVTSYMFQTLQEYVSHKDEDQNELGTKVMLKVYANTSRMNAFANEGQYVTGRQTDAGTTTWESGDFCMSNNTETTAFLAPAAAGKDGTTKANAWVINGGGTGNQAQVVLDRLATRFDLDYGMNGTDKRTNGIYTAEAVEGLTITMEGVAINTHETRAYWFLQSGDATPARDHVCSPKLQFNNGNADDTPSTYVHNYDLVLPSSTSAKSTTYAHPHTLASTFFSGGKYDIGFKNASYAAIKCSFSHTSMPANATKVYAYNGYYLGTFEQFKNGDLLDLYESYPEETIQAWISETRTSTTLSEESLAKACKEYVKEGNKFYTYYSVILRNDGHDSKATRTLENVKMYRNTCYTISVDKINKLGYAGGDVPADEVEDSMLWIDLNIKVAPWSSNKSNTGLEL